MGKNDKKNWHEFKEEHDTTQEQEFVEEELNSEENPVHEESLPHYSYEELSNQLTLAQQKAHEHWEMSVRAKAELDNVLRRTKREISDASRYSIGKLVDALLPVLDSLEQANQIALKENHVTMHEGLELTIKLFLDAFKKFDVQQIDPIGEPFNPQEHEAMTMQDAPDAEPNSVISVFQKGYKLSDRVIRPARVIVSKK
jgi:molecular chaperone GrpE